MDFLRSVTMTYTTSLHRPAMWMSHLITSIWVGAVTSASCATFSNGSIPAGSTVWEFERFLHQKWDHGEIAREHCSRQDLS